MSKLSWHFQGRPAQIVDIVRGARCEWVKVIDPPEGGSPFPGKKVVGRIWIGGDGVEGEYVRQGADGAIAYLEHPKGDDNARLLDYMLRRPYVTAWEGPNEPQPIDAGWFRPLLNDFEIRRALLLKANDLKSVVLCLNESALKSPHEAEQLGYAAQQGDYVGLHNYAAPAMWDIADLAGHRQFLHYRAVYQWWRNAGFDPASLLISEMGIDGGVIGRARTGWRTHTDGEDEYMEQLAWADDRMIDDEYVVAGFVFTAGADPEKFRDFDLITSLSRKMAMRTHTHPHEGEQTPPPTPAPTDFMQRLMALAEPSVIPMTPGHALFDAIEADDRIPCSREDRADLDGERWAFQWGFDSADNTRWLYACVEHDWGNILKAERPN